MFMIELALKLMGLRWLFVTAADWRWNLFDGAVVLLSLPELFHAIEKDQVAVLSKVPGIGKRTAERLCLELKGKLATPLGGTVATPLLQRSRAEPDPLQLALAQLDYRKSEIDNVLGSGEIPSKEEASLQERLRAALRFLATQQ